jgi:hypothetical protein
VRSPATASPIDRSPSGLPIGVQIIGPYLEDRTTIALLNFLNRSSAVSYRLRVTQGDGRLGNARRTSSLISALGHLRTQWTRCPHAPDRVGVAASQEGLGESKVAEVDALPLARSDFSAGFSRFLNRGALIPCRGRSRRTRIPARGAEATRQSATRQWRAEVELISAGYLSCAKISARAWELRLTMKLVRLLARPGRSRTKLKRCSPLYKCLNEGFDIAM